MKKYITELVGTFFLVLTIGLSVIGGAASAPLFIGIGLTALIYAGGHISGAHYNPAVTLAVWLRGKCEPKDIAPYILSQIAGAVLAAVTVKFLLSGADKAMSPVVSKAFVAEVLGTFALVWVILNVATTKATSGNSYYGLAIGGTVAAMATALGSISGGAFNPAVAIGVVVMGMIQSSSLWIYLVACPLGAVLAALLFKSIKADD